MNSALEGGRLDAEPPLGSPAGTAVRALAFALVYFVTGQIGLLIQTGHTGVTPVWPPSGIAMFAFIIWGPRMWPGLALGLGMLALYNHVPAVAVTISFLGQLAEALLGRFFVRRFALDRRLESSGDVLRFSLLVALLPPMVSALVGSTGMILGGAASWSGAPSMWLYWWLGDVTGIMVITPLLFSWSSGSGERFSRARLAELTVLLAALSALGWITFGAPAHVATHSPPIFYLLIPFTIWAAIRLGARGASLTSAVICGWLLWGAARGAGPFSYAGGMSTILSEVAFLVVTTASSLVVAALFGERARAEESLRHAGRLLEARVRERTVDLEAAKEQAVAASRAKSRFLADVSHELRTPMTGVIGFAKLLTRTELDQPQRQYVDIIRRSADDLLVVINDLLDLSRVEASHIQIRRLPCEVRHCLDDVIALLRPRADERGLALTRQVADDVPAFVVGDPVRLRQVLINLVANALKFTESGAVEIHVSVSREAPPGLLLRCAVKDTGPGLGLTEQHELFQAFHRFEKSSSVTDGTGLGLAISKSLVELMGGAIGVESAPGQGSVFWFTIPVEELRDSLGESPPVSAPPPPVRGRPKVLVADDSPTNRKLMQLLLTSVGMDTADAEDGEQVLAMMRAAHFDLVLMDIRMPRIDGIEATRQIRGMDGDKSRTPIVALTAHALPSERDEFLLAGMDDCLTKPVDEVELWRVVARYIGDGVEPPSGGDPRRGADGTARAPATASDPS